VRDTISFPASLYWKTLYIYWYDFFCCRAVVQFKINTKKPFKSLTFYPVPEGVQRPLTLLIYGTSQQPPTPFRPCNRPKNGGRTKNSAGHFGFGGGIEIEKKEANFHCRVIFCVNFLFSIARVKKIAVGFLKGEKIIKGPNAVADTIKFNHDPLFRAVIFFSDGHWLSKSAQTDVFRTALFISNAPPVEAVETFKNRLLFFTKSN